MVLNEERLYDELYHEVELLEKYFSDGASMEGLPTKREWAANLLKEIGSNVNLKSHERKQLTEMLNRNNLD